MKKVLLIITDYLSLPEGSIYLADEYENSLGVNSIDFFPDLISAENLDVQVFLTSHHPDIINKIPYRNWYITYRRGGDVRFEYGEQLEKRFSESSQPGFIQLINDDFL